MNSNLLAGLGLVLIVVAVAVLAGPWWAVLLAGLLLVAMGAVAWYGAEASSATLEAGMREAMQARGFDIEFPGGVPVVTPIDPDRAPHGTP